MSGVNIWFREKPVNFSCVSQMQTYCPQSKLLPRFNSKNQRQEIGTKIHRKKDFAVLHNPLFTKPQAGNPSAIRVLFS